MGASPGCSAGEDETTEGRDRGAGTSPPSSGGYPTTLCGKRVAHTNIGRKTRNCPVDGGRSTRQDSHICIMVVSRYDATIVEVKELPMVEAGEVRLEEVEQRYGPDRPTQLPGDPFPVEYLRDEDREVPLDDE